MGLAVVPDDWTSGYIDICVTWPDSVQWLAILRGLLAEPISISFFDPFTGDPTDALEAIQETLDTNLHLQECIVIPPGLISAFGADEAPAGWLLCDGSTVSRTTYANLFAVIGEIYGDGDGSTTFELPNLKGRVPVGQTNEFSVFHDLGQAEGEIRHTLQLGDIPAHTHTQDAHNHTQNTHTHTQDTHNHTQDTHNHTQNTHTHTQDTHNHTQNAHTHAYPAQAYINQAGSTFTIGVGAQIINTAANPSTTATNQTTVATNQTTVATNQTTVATNQTTVATNQTTVATNQTTVATNQNAGGGSSHNNLQPYLVINYIIKT